MIDGIPVAQLFNGVGTVGLVILLGLGFATSRIYTRAQVLDMQARHKDEMDRLVKAHEREITDANHERGEWRTEARLNQQAVVELSEQNRAMLTAFGPTLTDFLDNLRRLATRLRAEEVES